MQFERNRVPYPWTFEIPALVGVGLLVVISVAVQMGRAMANLACGAGWAWPGTGVGGRISATFTSLPGVLAGNAAAGLSPTPAHTATAPVLAGWTLVSVVVAMSVLGIAAAWAVRRWGPGRMRGFATASQARDALGIRRLRRNAAIIRPDLVNTPPSGGHDGYHPSV